MVVAGYGRKIAVCRRNGESCCPRCCTDFGIGNGSFDVKIQNTV